MPLAYQARDETSFVDNGNSKMQHLTAGILTITILSVRITNTSKFHAHSRRFSRFQNARPYRRIVGGRAGRGRAPGQPHTATQQDSADGAGRGVWVFGADGEFSGGGRDVGTSAGRGAGGRAAGAGRGGGGHRVRPAGAGAALQRRRSAGA